MYTKGYGGQDLSKVITIDSNDPERPETTIRVTGKVESFAFIHPDRVQLSGTSGAPLSTQVVVSPRPEFPFKIVDVKLQRGMDVGLSLERKTTEAGKPEYVVTLDNLRKDPGRYYDNLLIRTDSKVSPELRVAIFGNIAKPPENLLEKVPPPVEADPVQPPDPETPQPPPSPAG